MYKSGFVSLLGKPNAGKSTISNKIIGQKISITSSRPQTTRKKIMGIYTDEKGQIVFCDTPGLHNSHNKLDEFMQDEARKSIDEADVLVYVTECRNPDDEDKKYVEELIAKKLPTIIVLNKVDLLKQKEQALKLIEAYSVLAPGIDIIPVSALKEDLENLKNLIFEKLPEGEPYFSEDEITNETIRDISSEFVREAILRNVHDEIPHGVCVVIDEMKEKKTAFSIKASIICEKESHKGILIGKGASMIKKIGIEARENIEKMCEKKINLELFVKVRPNWRKNELELKEFGLSKK